MSDHPGPGWKANPGADRPPKGTFGKRVRVILRHGREGSYDGGTMVAPGWAADGKGGCRWSHTGSPYDIMWYRVL